MIQLDRPPLVTINILMGITALGDIVMKLVLEDSLVADRLVLELPPEIGFGRKNKHNNAPVANPAPTHSAGVTAAQPNTAAPRSNVSTSPLQLRC